MALHMMTRRYGNWAKLTLPRPIVAFRYVSVLVAYVTLLDCTYTLIIHLDNVIYVRPNFVCDLWIGIDPSPGISG